MRFTYRSGQRVLDGYTLKRGVGQGGFGEVYFAVSDGGKEVALKLLKGHTDIELRGIANCLNLKHPNLVHVYDLRADDHGETWLVMEYVLGESLSQVIGRHPTGLPINLAKEWFLNLSRAVGYLHDHGVVHRDLKPANIFVENGTLKVGDYGLCKSLHSSQKQTRTVGTVHYMAPEVSTGNYNKQIDIYACGVILHEMLTGVVPFDGESDGEILMKHLTATPDLSKVPGTFQAVVAKALDKNPLRRYGSAAEMARAVEGASLAMASPVQVPVVAGPVAIPHADIPPAPPPIVQPITIAAPAPVPAPAALPVAVALPPKPVPPLDLPQARPVSFATIRDRLTDLTGSLVVAPLVAALALVPYALIAQTDDWVGLGKMFLLTTLLSWAFLVGGARVLANPRGSWGPRLRFALLGMTVGAVAFWFDGYTIPRIAGSEATSSDVSLFFDTIHLSRDGLSIGIRYLLYFGGVFGLGRWWLAVARDRKTRFTLFTPIAAGFWSAALLFLWPWESGSPITGGIVPLVLATLAAQIASPWTPPPSPAPKKLKLRSV